DTANGFVEIAKSDNTNGQEINIATNNEISIGDLAHNIIELINPAAKIITDEERLRPEKSEVERLYGDNTKIKELTNWNPNHSLKEGLKETIEWFSIKENLSNYKANIYNV
ncbi:MAG: GDP-mannose 4,6-dehydratase, partial [Flavobacteriales bacterium]|nr:GDP-mannose 4,6-dehydratase [Flavobacteriales bacterium]